MSDGPGEWIKLPLMPPKLEARIAQYGIELPPFVAVYDRILVYPLDKADQPDATAGGIILAESTKAKLGAQRGVIVSMGVKAAQEMFSHGLGLGDIIIMARFSEYERVYFSQTRRPHRVCILQAGEIACSEDLKRDLESGDLHYQINTETGEVQVSERRRNDPPTIDIGEGV